MKVSTTLLCLCVALMLTGCGLSSPFIQATPPVPKHLLLPCEESKPPRDGHLLTISHALINEVALRRECAQSKQDLIDAVETRQK